MKFEHTEVFNFEGALRGMRNPLNSWAKSDSVFDIYCSHEDFDVVDESAGLWANKALENVVCDNDEENYDKEYEEKYEEFHSWLWAEGMTSIGVDHHYQANIIGPNDMGLAKRLIAAGTEHRKFLRQIFVSVDITAPLYWWKEFDTYKVGTTANSTSTMHKLASTPITLNCFETDDYNDMVDIFNNPSPMEYPLHDFISCPDGLLDMLESLRVKYNETKDKRYWKELIRWLPNGWLQTRTVTMNYENLRSMYHQRKNHKLTEWHSFCEWVESLPYAKEFIID